MGSSPAAGHVVWFAAPVSVQRAGTLAGVVYRTQQVLHILRLAVMACIPTTYYPHLAPLYAALAPLQVSRGLVEVVESTSTTYHHHLSPLYAGLMPCMLASVL
jgi:hypothetical protein